MLERAPAIDFGEITSVATCPPQATPAPPGVPRPPTPGKKEAPAVAVSGRSGDPRYDIAKPGITGRDRTVVGVVAHVGSDPDEVRDLAGAHVQPELRELHDVGGAARRVVADVRVVHEGVVFHRVIAGGGPHVAGRGHVLHVGLPRTPARFHLVRDVRRVHIAGGAVTGDPKGAAGRQRGVVGQTRMGCREVVGGQAVRRREVVDEGRVGAANHRTVLVVLHHDHEDVRKGREGGPRGRWWRGIAWRARAGGGGGSPRGGGRGCGCRRRDPADQAGPGGRRGSAPTQPPRGGAGGGVFPGDAPRPSGGVWPAPGGGGATPTR